MPTMVTRPYGIHFQSVCTSNKCRKSSLLFVIECTETAEPLCPRSVAVLRRSQRPWATWESRVTSCSPTSFCYFCTLISWAGAKGPQLLRAVSYVALAGAKNTLSACRALTGTYMSEQTPRPFFVRNPKLKAIDTIPR